VKNFIGDIAMKISVDLGSGPAPRNPFNAEQVIGLDVSDFASNVRRCDIGFERLPFDDSSVDYVTAFDLVEHIPRAGGIAPNRNPFIFLMNEIYRILKNDGRFFAQTPAYPYPTAFSDPTHVNFITSDTIKYFGKEMMGDGTVVGDDRVNLGRRYGFTGDFLILRNYSNQQFGHQIWLLKALK
jgi:SAM-dependent methyltransferase